MSLKPFHLKTRNLKTMFSVCCPDVGSLSRRHLPVEVPQEDHQKLALCLNPVTINPVIRMSCLGSFFSPRDSAALPSNSGPGAYN